MRGARIQSRGFTLMELILVLAIIGIAAAIVAPSLTSFAAGRSNQDAGTLIMSLAGYARTQSISQGRTYRLNVDTAKNQVWLTAGSAGVFSSLTDEFGEQFQISTGITMKTDVVAQNGSQYIEFNSNGRCQPARFWLTDRYGREIEVACDSPTELFRVVPASEMTQ
jgi:type II secretion system protein H